MFRTAEIRLLLQFYIRSTFELFGLAGYLSKMRANGFKVELMMFTLLLKLFGLSDSI